MVAAGLNKYGQRLDEFNEFGQSLEAEVWYFAAAGDRVNGTADNGTLRKPVTVGLNRYGQRLDEFNEFGQSLEAEVWHFDHDVEITGVPVAAAGVGTVFPETHLQAA